MKRAFIILGLYLIPYLAYGQVADSLDRDQMDWTMRSAESFSRKTPVENKANFNLTVGTSFGFSPGNYYAPSLHLMPSVQYPLGKRFSLSGGLILQQSQVYPLYNNPNDEFLPMTRAYLYARGDYRVNERLILHSSVFTSVGSTTPDATDAGQNAARNIEAMEMGVEYKLSDSFSVGFQMRMRKGSPYYYDPFNPYSGGNYWLDPF